MCIYIYPFFFFFGLEGREHPSCLQVNRSRNQHRTASNTNYHSTQSINPSLSPCHSQHTNTGKLFCLSLGIYLKLINKTILWSAATLKPPASYCVGPPRATKTAQTCEDLDITDFWRWHQDVGAWGDLPTHPTDARLDWDLGNLTAKSTHWSLKPFLNNVSGVAGGIILFKEAIRGYSRVGYVTRFVLSNTAQIGVKVTLK